MVIENPKKLKSIRNAARNSSRTITPSDNIKKLEQIVDFINND